MSTLQPSPFSRRQLLAGMSAIAASGLAGGFPVPVLAKAPMLNTQAPAFYRFKIGGIEATVVSDGPLTLGPPQPGIFAGISREDLVKLLADNFLPTNDLPFEQNTLVINTGDRLALIDTGTGSAKVFGNRTGRQLANLKAAGIDPKDIDAVVLTHAHADHCWGLMADDGTRNFPNAQIHIAQSDFDFWTDADKTSHPVLGAFIEPTRRQLLPNRDRIVFLKEGREVVPGVQAMAAPGHTVGHTIFVISSQGKTMCNVGDLVHQYVLALERPRVEFAYDTDGKQAAASRIRVLDMLAAQKMPLLAYHFPWPGLGHVTKQGDGYRYFPSPMQTAL
jgi:glyoxylase-like metal-dependent hydrolase (beta-lactamase superfamily II)